MHTTHIHLRDLYGGSPLLRFLYGRLGPVVTVPGACLLWVLVLTGLFALLCWQQGTLLPKPVRGRMSLLEDTTALSNYVLLPLCFLLLYYSLHLFRRYLNRLNEVLEPTCPATAHGELLDSARASFEQTGPRTHRFLLLAFGLVIFGYNTLTNSFPGFFYGRPQKWDGLGFPVSYVAARLYVLFVWGYAMPLWMSEVYLQLAVMVKINTRMAKEGWLRISPCAQDGFAGLSRLAGAATCVGFVILATGLFFLAPLLRSVLWQLPLHAGNYLGLGLYVVFASAGTFVPLYLLHRILARKRREMLEDFAGAFDVLNARVTELVHKKDFKALEQEGLGGAVEAIDRLRAQWRALPVWPLSVAFFVKVLATVIPPVVVVLVQQFTRKIPL
jgi:hypothetical protein